MIFGLAQIVVNRFEGVKYCGKLRDKLPPKWSGLSVILKNKTSTRSPKDYVAYN